MVEVAKEFVEAVFCGEKFIPITEVVFTVLPGDVALTLEQSGQGHILVTDTLVRTRGTYLGKTRANR